MEVVSKDIMETLDEDGDGDISKEEFIKHALKRKGFPRENDALILLKQPFIITIA